MVKDGLKRIIERVEKEKFTYVEKNRFITISLPERAIAPFLTEIGKQGIEYDEIDINRPSLEDFFLSASKGEI